LLQAQVDQYALSNESWLEARLLLEEGLTTDGMMSENLANIFEKLGWFDGKSPLEAEDFRQQITEWGASALQWAVVSDSAATAASSINKTSAQNLASLTNILGTSKDGTITESLDKAK
jgi:hypothetical protein